MAEKKFIMVLSSEESRDMLKMLQKSLRIAKKMIKEVSSNLEKAKLNTALDDEINAKRIDRFEKELIKMKVKYSIKLRFVQHLEEKFGDSNINITTEIKITEKDEEESICEDCLYNIIRFGCTIGKKVIDGKCKFCT